MHRPSARHRAYGASGQRISKQVGGAVGDPGTYREHYIRDAQGNIMATYRLHANGAFRLQERPIYGSSRVGLYAAKVDLYPAGQIVPLPQVIPVFDGLLRYELNDHLGNVGTVVTGRLLPGQGAPHEAEVISAQGYEPFGSLLPGRNYSSGSYNYGFQGQIEDDEIHGATGTSYAFEYRMHDPRVGRFWSIDPLAAQFPHNSPYAFSENRVIDAFEFEGLEEVLVNPTVNPKDQDIYDAGMKEKDQSAIHIFAHGNYQGFRNDQGTVTRITTPQQFTALLEKESEQWRARRDGESTVIVLHSCDNGRTVKGHVPFAQKASEEMRDVIIVAPEDWDYFAPGGVELGPRITEGLTENRWYTDDGHGGYKPTSHSAPARWNVFRNGERLFSFDGDEKLVGSDVKKAVEMFDEIVNPPVQIMARDGQ